MALMPRLNRPYLTCQGCGVNLRDSLGHKGLCYACELYLEAVSDGLDPEEVDTSVEQARRALGILDVRGQYLNAVDDPDDSSFLPF